MKYRRMRQRRHIDFDQSLIDFVRLALGRRTIAPLVRRLLRQWAEQQLGETYESFLAREGHYDVIALRHAGLEPRESFEFPASPWDDVIDNPRAAKRERPARRKR